MKRVFSKYNLWPSIPNAHHILEKWGNISFRLSGKLAKVTVGSLPAPSVLLVEEAQEAGPAAMTAILCFLSTRVCILLESLNLATVAKHMWQ